MKVFFLYISSILFCVGLSAQSTTETTSPSKPKINGPQAGDSLKIFRPTIQDYRFWHVGETVQIIDTAHTVQNFYNQNFIQKDIFGLMPFPNSGQTYNPLMYQEEKNNQLQLLPKGKSYNYLRPEDIKYYDVKTPMTEFLYENGVKEGQALSTTFTHSPSKRFNYALQYRGLRSEGRYLQQLAANNSFVVSTNYHTKNERYHLWAHYVSQNIDNQENGGIATLSNFDSGSATFRNRQRIPVNLTGATSEFDSRRVLIGQEYGLWQVMNPVDSTKYFSVSIKNVFSYEKQKDIYKETQANTFYTSTYLTTYDAAGTRSFTTLRNQTTGVFKWSDKLNFEAGVRFERLNLSIEPTTETNLLGLPESIKDNLFSMVGKLDFTWNEKLKLTSNGEYTTGTTFKNMYLVEGNLVFQPVKGYKIEGNVLSQSKAPSLNYYLNRSIYTDFNYYNPNLKNVTTQKIGGSLYADVFKTKISAFFYNIGNYAFLGSDALPTQLNSNLNIAQLKIENEIKYRKFHLNTTILLQKGNQDEVLPLPTFVGRGTLYYQSLAFKKAAEIQTGVNLYYFSQFKSRDFFGVTNDFMLQDDSNPQTIGAFPLIDVFFNVKVKRMRFYIRAEHLNSSFTGSNYYSAPAIPYHDFKFQLGIKWYLFT